MHILKKKKKLSTLIKIIRKNKTLRERERERESTHSFLWGKYGGSVIVK